MLANKVCWQ